MWPTVAALPVFLALLGLGTWQVQRMHWKDALIAERAAELAAPPIEAAQIGPGLEFRRVRATGGFLNDRTIFLEGRTHQGEPGYHAVTPLALRAGGTVPVDRGWVRTRTPPPATGEAVVDGIVRKGGKPSGWTPDNDPARNVWFYIDAPYYIDTGPPPAIPNNHLQYAVTWYGLAAALAAIYGVMIRRRLSTQ
jgi:surfeit locus 1 family protein